MVTGTAKLIIDLGNSDTKMMVKFGKDNNGATRAKLMTLSNRFGLIEPSQVQSYLNNPVYADDTSRVFIHNGDTYCNGEMCLTEFGSTADRPTSLQKKYESLITTLTIKNAFCKAYDAVAAFTNSDYDSVNVDWDLVMLLPPDDIEAGSKALAGLARAITQVEYLKPKFQKDIKINNIKIYPEGFAGFIAVLYESLGTIRKGYEYLVAKNVSTLVIDIGAGTTDFILVKGCNVVNSTRFTREVGGNNVHQKLRRSMKQAGIVLTDSAAREGCETGYVYSGAKKYNVTANIAQAKKQVSRQLVDAIQEFFEDSMMPIQSINNILICGGGAEVSKVPDIEPISKYIFEYMQNLSKDVNLVELPVDPDGDGEEKLSSRMLNIIGAGILAG